jgi:protein translocase SecG subunit
MSGFLTVLIILVCILLIIVVLIQNSKGGGIASNFAASNQVMGVQKTTEVIEKITWGLAISLVVLKTPNPNQFKTSRPEHQNRHPHLPENNTVNQFIIGLLVHS